MNRKYFLVARSGHVNQIAAKNRPQEMLTVGALNSQHGNTTLRDQVFISAPENFQDLTPKHIKNVSDQLLNGMCLCLLIHMHVQFIF